MNANDVSPEVLHETHEIIVHLADVLGVLESFSDALPDDAALWAALSLARELGGEDADPHFDRLVNLAVSAIVDIRREVDSMLRSPIEAAEAITKE